MCHYPLDRILKDEQESFRRKDPLSELCEFISSNLAFHSQGFSATFRWLSHSHHPLLSLNRHGSAWKFRLPPPPKRMAPSTKASLLCWPVGQTLRHNIHFRAPLESGRVWGFTQNCIFVCLLEKTLKSTLDSKEIQLVNPKGNQSWIVTGKTYAEAEAPVPGPFDVKSQLIGKDPDAGKDWRQKEKGATEDEMVGWHHWLNGHESEHNPGNGEGWGSLVSCSPWGCRELDTTDWLSSNWLLRFLIGSSHLKGHLASKNSLRPNPCSVHPGRTSLRECLSEQGLSSCMFQKSKISDQMNLYCVWK